MEKNDFDQRLKFILEALDRKKFEMTAEGAAYHWNYAAPLEDARLELQNQRTGKGWADGHRQFLQKLSAAGFTPKTIAIIGTGKDAALIPDAFVFPEVEKVLVFEIDEKKIAGANETLKTLNVDMDKIEFIQGNAATMLLRFTDSFDLLAHQLLLQHLSTRPAPPWLKGEAKNNFCTLSEMITAMSRSLKKGGVMAASDFMIGREWGFEPAYGSTPNNAIFDLIRQQEGLIARFKELGWINRGASTWNSLEEIIKAASNNCGNALKVVSDLNYTISSNAGDRDSQERLHLMVAYVMSAVLLGFDANLAATRKASAADPTNQMLKEVVGKLEKGAEFLWKTVPPHIQLLGKMEIYLKKISMYYLAFEKI
jgi:tRNA G46 methylase TrmB